MENHPIPQDITGFQFKLVGKMTVRQFIYVAVGVFLAWLIYFVLKFPIFLSLPLALFFSLGGAALAFLPIDGRPMDVMIRNFISSVLAPTQYIYEKHGGEAFSPGQTNVSSQVSQSLPTSNQTPAVQQSAPLLTPVPQTISSAPTLPAREEKIEAQEEIVEKEEIKPAQSQHLEALQIQAKLDEAMRQKEELEKQLLELKGNLENPIPTPTPTLPEPVATANPPSPMPESTPVVTPVSQAPVQPIPPLPVDQPAAPAAFPAPAINTLPEEPSVIKGTVKDSRGNPLQNILVEVKDEEDNPVRAFKTNSKGEFASATSLPNGAYSVVLEDPKMVHKFDTSHIEVTGGVLTPLGIISIDPREELRRELFN